MPRKITIHKSLALFPSESGRFDQHKVIPSGSYEVEPVPNPIKKTGGAWFKLAGEPWANARPCWESVAVAPEQVGRSSAPKSQTPVLVLGALCLGLMLLTFDFKPPPRKVPVDVSALKMELDGTVNQLQNLTNHYPLMLSEPQKRYRQLREDALYAMEVYPPYRKMQQAQQQEILRQRPDLEPFVTALNNLDEQLYRAWHEWGLKNRAEQVGALKKEREQLLGSGVMLQQSGAYRALQATCFTDEMAPGCLEFGERLEEAVADGNPGLADVARQNRDCAEHALKLILKINQLRSEIASVKKPEKFFQTAALQIYFRGNSISEKRVSMLFRGVSFFGLSAWRK